MVALAVHPSSTICRQHFQRNSSLKLLGQFHLNFICSLPAKRGKNVYILGLGHMTKIGAMPKYGKNLKKSSYPEPLGQLP